MSQSSRQADSIAAIALELPEQPTTSDVLRALALAYRAGRNSVLNQSEHDEANLAVRGAADPGPAQLG